MRILVVDDYSAKRAEIVAELNRWGLRLQVSEARSVIGGVRAVVAELPDLVVLDMSLPTYDVRVGDEGGRHQSFGGREVLEHLSRRGITVAVVVVTQFEDFGTGDDYRTLQQLSAELQSSFPGLFRCTLSFRTSEDTWRHALRGEVEKLQSST